MKPTVAQYPLMSWHQQPTGFQTWVDNILRVIRHCSNQLGQRVRPTSERLVGQLGCHNSDGFL